MSKKDPKSKEKIRKQGGEAIAEQDKTTQAAQLTLDGESSEITKRGKKAATRDNQKWYEKLMLKYEGKLPIDDIAFPFLFPHGAESTFATTVDYWSNKWEANPIEVAALLQKTGKSIQPAFHQLLPKETIIQKSNTVVHLHANTSNTNTATEYKLKKEPPIIDAPTTQGGSNE